MATSTDAVDAWNKGQANYNFIKGEPMDKNDVAKKKLSDEFTRMVWKSSTTVGFGIKGKFVVAWICKKKGNDPYTTKDFLANVKKNCIKGGVNTCFNSISLAAINEKRKWHQVKSLTTDVPTAKAV